MKLSLAPVISNEEVMPGTHLVWLDCPEIATTAQPGQFIMVNCGEETFLRRPLSIHRIDGDKLALLFNIVGKGTAWLAERKPGNEIDIFGPLGNGFTLPDKDAKILLVAGGMGIAPLVFLAEKAHNQNCSVKLLLGVPTAAQIYSCDFLNKEIEVIYITEDALSGNRGRVTVLVPNYSAWADQIFACGPLPMYRNLAENFPQLKDKPVQISLEMRMACGLGVCYGCTIKTRKGLKQVCKDGPVFDLADIIWEELS